MQSLSAGVRLLLFVGLMCSTAAAQDIPEEVRKHLRHELSGSFLVTRDKVQEELKLTQEQKEKVDQHLRELLPDLMQFFQTLEGLKPEERQKAVGPFRKQVNERLASRLKETLDDAQRTRLQQLKLQREGLFGDGEIMKDLRVTDAQRQQFMPEIQQAQRGIEPLLKEAHQSGNPDKIRPKVMKIREELEGKLESLLTDDQRKQWKEMLGKPIESSALFDEWS